MLSKNPILVVCEWCMVNSHELSIVMFDCQKVARDTDGILAL